MADETGQLTVTGERAKLDTVKRDLARSLTTLDALGFDYAAIHVDQALWSLMSPDEQKRAITQARATFGGRYENWHPST